MANILSGADFGVQFPQNGGVASNRFAISLASQLMGKELDRNHQSDLQDVRQNRADGRLASQQAFTTQQAEQVAAAGAEEKRLGAMSIRLTQIKNMKDPVQKRTALAQFGRSEMEGGRDGSEFIQALNADTLDQLGLNIDKLIGKSEAFRGEASEWLKQNAPNTAGFEAIADGDGNIIAQRNIETGEVKADPRASKLFSEEEMSQKMQLIEGRAKATVAEQQNTPQAKVSLEMSQERLRELQQNNKLKLVKIDETKLKNAEDKNDANEVKQIRFNEASNVVNQIGALLEGNVFESAFGKAVTITPEMLRSQESIDAIANVDQIRALLSLESRQKLKGSGTISDNEQKTLEKSATVLANPLISSELAENELIKVQRIFEDSIRRNKVKQQAQPDEQPQEIPEGATATNPTTGEKIIYRGGQWVSS